MDGSDPSVLFLGDLGDPWVAALAECLPAAAERVACPEPLPDDIPPADVVVVHRPILAAPDAEALRRLRDRGSRTILCIGPHIRARDVEQFAGAADLVLPEATASETIARHLAPIRADEDDPAARPIRPLVAVVASGYETRRMLVEACERLGYPARPFIAWEEATPSRLAVWDVSVLETGWEGAMREAAMRRAIVALIGFADRGLVSAAKEAGAAACLEFPLDVADLGFVLDRLASRPDPLPMIDGPHAVPPRPRALRLVRPPVAEPLGGA